MGHTYRRNKGATTAELSKHQGQTSTHLHSRLTSPHASPSSLSNPALHHSLGSFTTYCPAASPLYLQRKECKGDIGSDRASSDVFSESATSGTLTASSFPKSSPRSQKLHSVEERAREDTERSSKKIPWLIFSFLFSTLCDLDQTLLADICAHCHLPWLWPPATQSQVVW
ncbi:hypothetical protein Pelo_16360 [Pelomyxa schiedti]|nr:hypothetical protein Pelo_16360 [Pelomyxa schiedti]